MRCRALLLFVPIIAVAQSPFDASRLIPRSDSFVVTVQGRQVGGIRETIEMTATGFRIVSVAASQGITESTEVHVSRALAMVSVKRETHAFGNSSKVDVTYERGRAKGTVTARGAQGIKPITVDTTVPPGAVDDNALQSLLPALPLGAGQTFEVLVWAPGDGTGRVMTVTVSGSESVTVPAGTFDAWKVNVTGDEGRANFWVSRANPRVVKMGYVGAPMAVELVK